MTTNDLTIRISERFGRFVTPLYRRGEGETLVPEGSGVLVRSRVGCWLFTAAHNFNQTDVLFVPTRTAPIPFSKSRFAGCESILDLFFAAVPAHEEEALRTSGLAFIHGNAVEECITPPPPNECAFIGYPDKCVVMNHSLLRIDVRTALLHSTFLPPVQYRDHRLDRGYHIASRFTGFGAVKTDGTYEKLEQFDPSGLSGGAIMQVRPDGTITLVGIATDFRENSGLIFGCRFNRLISQLRRQTKSMDR